MRRGSVGSRGVPRPSGVNGAASTPQLPTRSPESASSASSSTCGRGFSGEKRLLQILAHLAGELLLVVVGVAFGKGLRGA